MTNNELYMQSVKLTNAKANLDKITDVKIEDYSTFNEDLVTVNYGNHIEYIPCRNKNEAKSVCDYLKELIAKKAAHEQEIIAKERD